MRIIVVLLIILAASCSEKKEIKISIQPYNDFNKALADTIYIALKKTYNAKVHLLNPIDIPPETFVNIKSPRYRADKLIDILKNQKPDSVNYIMGLTTQDISFTKKEGNKIKEPASKYEDWGIFGLGYQPGPSCVVSTFRLNSTGEKKFIERLKKVAVHELGHNMGLRHCTSELCVMKDAVESIKTVDQVSAQLCEQCKSKIE
ncbi:MAG TPA: matrixin family metalloprotease [Cyclobacteriaceae bacterium]|nr:matrixin family metalloprotease [Cyclobacteriaceae bacterium]